jgi:hypothetical protein
MLDNEAGQQDMRRVALDFWNGGGKVELALMLETLPRSQLVLPP